MLQDKFRNKYLKERKGGIVWGGELRLNGEINGGGTEKRAETMAMKAEGFGIYL